jgi:lipid-A-disaccharide synthase
MEPLTGEPAPLRLMLLAGEPSGDRHAARLVRALASRVPCAPFGIAGPEMRAAGVEPVVAMEDVAVLGLTEVLSRLGPLWAARRRLLRALDRRPEVVVPIDFPGFNLRFARHARRRGVPVLYYVSPQIWAWGRGRLGAIRRAVDHMAVVFPFEVPLYDAVGVPVTYVGHPLVEELEVDLDADALRRLAGLPGDAPYLALLPGSRGDEVARLFPAMLDAFRRLRRQHPTLGAVVAAASPGLAGALVELGATREPGVGLITGHTHAVAAHARAALVASGTATLETAALGTPLVIVYRLSWLSWMLASRLVRLSRIGLANIVAGEEVAPELLQGRATGEEMARAAEPLVADGPPRSRALARLAGVRERLGAPGAAARVAQLVLDLSGRGRDRRPMGGVSA